MAFLMFIFQVFAFDYLYYIHPQNNSFRSFILHPLPVLASYFHPLFYCSFPLLSYIHLTHLLLKPLPIPIYILINLHSKLFIHLPFVLINIPFNLCFFFVDLHKSILCNLIPISQYHLPCSLYYII